MNSKILWIVLAIVVVGGLGYFVMNRAPSTDTNYNVTTQQTGEQNQNNSAKGHVVFSVTDAAVNMSTISEISMKVSRVDVHSSGSGWATISTTPRVYNLLALNAKKQSELLADANLDVGTYDQVRLMVDAVTIKTKAGETKEAKLPSGELKINTELVVNENATASINFDFLASKSLHVTGNGEYIFAPVVKTETKSNAEVSVDTKNVVTISGGKVEDTNTAGMDIDGSVKANFEIKTDQKLDIDSNNTIKVLLN